MDVHVIPRRCVEAAYELRETENRLKREAEKIENIVNGLKRSGDENMLIVANDLNRTNESLKMKIRALRRMSMVLMKAAALYERTENDIRDHEDTSVARVAVKYRPVDLRGVLSGIKETFAKL